MARFGPEELKLKNGKIAIIRNCSAMDADLFPDFQRKVSWETTHTLQIESHHPSVEKIGETWGQWESDPVALRLGVFLEGEMIGQLGFHPVRSGHPWVQHVGHFGMMVLQNYWGQGIARRMLEIMHGHAQKAGVTRIEAFVRVNNPRAVRLYLMAGYKIEGTRKNAAFINGKFYDEYSISALLDGGSRPPAPIPLLETERLHIRPVFEASPRELVDYFTKNKAHFEAFDPATPPGYYTEEFWEKRISSGLREYSDESALRFALFPKQGRREIAGTINFTQIFKGPFQACYLGYGIGAEYEGKGLMSEALREVIKLMFSRYRIHRIMANHLPENSRSEKLLGRLGFKREGVAEDYLFINGQWRAHVLNSLTNQNWSAG